MQLYVDIDNTICDTKGIDYIHSKPRLKVIEEVNKCYDKGDRVVYWTARGTKTHMDWKQLTQEQLKAWGCKYHELLFGKPAFNLYIGDDCMDIETWMKSRL
jgi:hypothetical protein